MDVTYGKLCGRAALDPAVTDSRIPALQLAEITKVTYVVGIPFLSAKSM